MPILVLLRIEKFSARQTWCMENGDLRKCLANSCYDLDVSGTSSGLHFLF
jgi:hypothetical protein